MHSLPHTINTIDEARTAGEIVGRMLVKLYPDVEHIGQLFQLYQAISNAIDFTSDFLKCFFEEGYVHGFSNARCDIIHDRAVEQVKRERALEEQARKCRKRELTVIGQIAM